MAHLLGGEALGLEFPSGRVFDSVTVGLAEGDRVGVVGRNGDGKSTLLSLLAGRLSPDSGRVTARRGVTIGMLSQDDMLDPDLMVEKAIVGDADEYEWARDSRVRSIIDGLVSELPWRARVGELSGGQRRRVALAGLLVGEYDVLLLDEPTNHLDVEGITWLAEHVKTRWNSNTGAFVVVTHDRWFLDEVCTTTWEVHDEVVEPFEGGYAAYILQRVERDRMAAATESKRQNLMRKELAWLRRGPPARTAKPKFRIEAATELIADVPAVRNAIELQRLAVGRLGKDVVDLEDVSVSFGDTEVLRNVEWRIAPGERAGILGVNGAGKSTLLRLITGELKPTSGKVKRGKTVKVATLTQNSDALDEIANERIRDVIAKKRATFAVEGREISASQLLERLGFTNAHMSSPIKDLSGGQKRRFHFLLILLDEPNVLVMDEPTNDLDTEILAAVEDLLDSWPGTLIVVSHDRYLIERVTDQQYAVIDGRFTHVPGGVEQYVRLRRGGTPASARTSGQGGDVAKSARRLEVADRHAAQKEFASIERKLVKLPSQIAQAEARIASHDQADYDGLTGLAETLNALKHKSADLEHRWLELSELLE